MNLPAALALTAPIGGQPYYANIFGDGSVQVTQTPQTWTATPVNPSDPAQGYTLSVEGKYLTTKTVNLQYKNQCLVVSTDISQAAKVVPVQSGASYYLRLVGSSNIFTLDTRGYVTQFEPLVPTNDYPYFQHLTPPVPPTPAYFTLTVHNESGKTVVAPAGTAQIAAGQQSLVMVQGVGSITLQNLGQDSSGQGRVQVTSGALKQVVTYTGNSQLTLKLLSDNSFDLTVPGSPGLQGAITGTNPAAVALPANQRVYVTAFTNADYLQRVTLTVNNGTPMQWQGKGEGNREMANTSFLTPADPSGWVNATLYFEFAPDGANFQPSKFSPVGNFSMYGYNQRTVVSEDADDDDYNDSAVILSWWVAPPAAR